MNILDIVKKNPSQINNNDDLRELWRDVNFY